jgi:hypothetical protein
MNKTYKRSKNKNKYKNINHSKTLKRETTTDKCPHMKQVGNQYAPITKSRPHTLVLDGHKYTFYTCCRTCCKDMLMLQKRKPAEFKRRYVKGTTNGNLYLKHKDTHKVVQIAKKSNAKGTNKSKCGKSKKSKKTTLKGGNRVVYGRGYGANCDTPDQSIFNTPLLKLFPYTP